MEDQFYKLLNFDVCVVYMYKDVQMDKQPGMQKFWNWYCPMGGNGYGKPGHSSIFIVLNHLNDAFEVLFFSSGLNLHW